MAGTPIPIFSTAFSGLMVTFYTVAKQKVGEKVGENLTDNQKQIFHQINANPYISATQLAGLVGISSRKIEANIKKLKSQGRLKRIGSAKGGHWEIVK